MEKTVKSKVTLIRIIAVIVIGIVAFIRSYRADSSEVQLDNNEMTLNEIATIYKNGELQTASTELDTYLKRYPKDDIAWTIKGNVLKRLDRDSLAKIAYLEAISLNSKNFQATNALGILSRRLGDKDKALEYYKKALAMKPDYAQTYSSMAVIELQKGNDKKALELALKGYNYNKKNPVILSNLAISYHHNSDYKNRDIYTQKAIEVGYKNGAILQKIYSGELTIRE